MVRSPVDLWAGMLLTLESAAPTDTTSKAVAEAAFSEAKALVARNANTRACEKLRLGLEGAF